MQKLKEVVSNNKFNILILLVWIFITLTTMFHHEIWRDEAQVWCIVRDLNFIDIFKTARIEGHPFLWYLILTPFAKLGVSVISMQIISLLLVFVSVLFLLFKSPFNRVEKVIICFSAGLLYYLPIVARNYALIPIFLFMIAHFYPKRKEKPFLYVILLILLSNTHLYMLGFCLIAGGLFFIEKIKETIESKNIKTLYPILLLGLNFLILFFTFINTTSSNYALDSSVKITLSFTDASSIIAKILSYNIVSHITYLQEHFNIVSIILFYPFIITILFGLLRVDKKIGFIYFCSISYMFILFTKIYFNGILYQKIYLIFLVIIACLWMTKHSLKVCRYTTISFYILFVISMLVSPFIILDDLKYNFSGGKQIASYIKKNINDEQTFITMGNPFLYSPISAYLPNKKLYNLISKSYISYYSYLKLKDNNIIVLPSDIKYSIVQENIDLSDNQYFDFVFKSDNKNLSSKTEREVFSIYKQK